MRHERMSTGLVRGALIRAGGRNEAQGAETWVTHWTRDCAEVEYMVSSTLVTLGTNDPHE